MIDIITVKADKPRDPTMGIPSFKTGTVLSRKNRVKDRSSKHAKRERERQMNGE